MVVPAPAGDAAVPVPAAAAASAVRVAASCRSLCRALARPWAVPTSAAAVSIPTENRATSRNAASSRRPSGLRSGPQRNHRSPVTGPSQPVAHAEDRLHEVIDGAEFAAQVLHVRVDGALVAGELVPADPVDQLVPGRRTCSRRGCRRVRCGGAPPGPAAPARWAERFGDVVVGAAAHPSMRSSTWLRAVSATTGTCRPSAWAAARICRPSTSGSPRSSTTRSSPPPSSRLSASAPDPVVCTVSPARSR
jgi:hypothetical protein